MKGNECFRLTGEEGGEREVTSDSSYQRRDSGQSAQHDRDQTQRLLSAVLTAVSALRGSTRFISYSLLFRHSYTTLWIQGSDGSTVRGLWPVLSHFDKIKILSARSVSLLISTSHRPSAHEDGQSKTKDDNRLW